MGKGVMWFLLADLCLPSSAASHLRPTLNAKKKDPQLALQVLAFLVGPPGVEPGTNGL